MTNSSAQRGGNRGRLSRVAAHTGFEDSNSSANVGIAGKAAGQRMILSNIGENLALLNNGSNGDSVPATVPGSRAGPADAPVVAPGTSSLSGIEG
jgi:hypothetical protein